MMNMPRRSNKMTVISGSTGEAFELKVHTSVREAIQDDLMEYIESFGFYNAPFGVLAGLNDLPHGGKVRSITFGVAATLDAELLIWSAKKLTLRTRGSLSQYFQTEYKSVEEFKKALEDVAT